MTTEHASAAPQNTTQQSANTGRTATGRFAAGNRGGPGNPFARQVAGMRQALLNSVTREEIARLGRGLLAMAEAGNMQAAKLLLAYMVGKPEPAPEPDRMDAHEWAIYQETAPMKQESAAVISAGPPDVHLNMVRTVRPIVGAAMAEQAAAVFLQTPEQLKQREAAEEAETAKWEAHLNSPAPSTNGGNGAKRPSTNGANGGKRPSTNGANGGKRPSTNGGKRSTPPDPGEPQPSTNGDFRPDPCPTA